MAYKVSEVIKASFLIVRALGTEVQSLRIYSKALLILGTMRFDNVQSFQ